MNPFLASLINGSSVPLLILLVSVFRRDSLRRRLDFTTVLAFVVYGAVASNLSALLRVSLVSTYDTAFLHADGLIGFDTISVANAITRHWFPVVVLQIVYTGLPIMIGLAWVLEQDLRMRRAVFIGGSLCFLFYGLFPAVGPRNFDWVHHVPMARAPYNCMPSMHFAWALLVALNAHSRGLRCVSWTFAVLTGAATLGMHEHYLVDLIASIPYTLAVQWLAGLRLADLPVFRSALPIASREAVSSES